MRRPAGWVAGWAMVLASLATGCSDYPGGAPRTERSATPAASAPPTTEPAPVDASTSPPPWVTEDLDEITTRPLVFAVDPRRAPLDLTLRQAHELQAGAVHRWRRLGLPGGVLRLPQLTTPLRQVPRDAVAVVVADAVTPAVRVATVEGVDPLLDPTSYPVQVQGPAPQLVTVLTVVHGRIESARDTPTPPAGFRPSLRRAGVDLGVDAPPMLAIFWGERLMALESGSDRRYR